MNDSSPASTVPADSGNSPGGGPTPAAKAGIGRIVARGAVRFAENYSLLLLLALVAVFFSVYGPTSDTFPTEQNFDVTIANQSILAIASLGLLIPLVAGKFDLSIGAVTGLSAVFIASAMSGGTAVVLAIAIGMALSLVVGVVNAFLVSRLEMDDVVATLGVATLIGGVVLKKTGGESIVANIPSSVREFGTGKLWFLPNSVVLLLVLAVIVHIYLEYTSAGRQIYALGSNPRAAKLVGLRTRLVLGGTFALAGVLAGAAGALYVSRSGGADPFAGVNLLLPAFAVVFLSAATVKPGTYNVGGMLIAVFFLATLNSGLNLAGAAPYVSEFVNGGALLAGVLLATFLRRRQQGR